MLKIRYHHWWPWMTTNQLATTNKQRLSITSCAIIKKWRRSSKYISSVFSCVMRMGIISWYHSGWGGGGREVMFTPSVFSCGKDEVDNIQTAEAKVGHIHHIFKNPWRKILSPCHSRISSTHPETSHDPWLGRETIVTMIIVMSVWCSKQQEVGQRIRDLWTYGVHNLEYTFCHCCCWPSWNALWDILLSYVHDCCTCHKTVGALGVLAEIK